MSPIEILSLPSTVRIAAWTLLHFLWQGALVAAVLAAALTALRRQGPQVRYAIALGALATLVALPLATGALLAARANDAASSTTKLAAARLSGADGAPDNAKASTVAGAHQALATQAGTAYPTYFRLEPLLPWLVGLWLIGVTALSCVQLGGWRRVRQLRKCGIGRVGKPLQATCDRLAERLAVRRSVKVLESALVRVPTVIGWLRPVILVPASALSGLSPRQLESILAHELAHVRRHDYLVNVLQVATETLLFYHPAVWWVSRQVRDLREHCCDDLAVAICGDRMVYARALAELEELRFAAPIFALGADGGALLGRIRRLAGGDTEERAPGWLAGGLAVSSLVASAILFILSTQPGQAQQADRDKQAPQLLSSPWVVPPMLIAQTAEEPPRPARPARPPAPPSPEEPPAPPSPTAPPAPPTPIDELIEMKVHGVDDLMEELAGTAYAELPLSQLIELAKFDIDRDVIQELAAVGFGDLETAELVELAKFDIDADVIAELRAAGYADLEIPQLVELAKFDIDADVIAELRAAGYADLEIPQLVELAKFDIDADVIAELRAAGYADLEIPQLVELAKFDIDADVIAELRAAGYAGLAIPQLIELAKFDIDADVIAELRAAGYADLAIPQLIELAKFDIDAELIGELGNAGYSDLSSAQLIELARYDVDAEFLNELGEAGLKLSIDDLIRLARYDIDGEFIQRMDRLRESSNP
ncbi:MAG: M56 family metallopeptidase [Acidobacteriota bacterium]